MYDSSHDPREPILNLPAVVGWLIAANVVIHGVLWALPESLGWSIKASLAFVPAQWTGAHLTPLTLLTPISHQFLHAGGFHLTVNMLMLAAFGAGVARAFGAWRFLALYFASGLVGALAHWAFYPSSPVPTLGASGAISGLFAAALIVLARDPRNRAQGFRFWPAAVIWVGISVIVGLTDLPGGEGSGGVAWAAHLGGFFAGIALSPVMRRGLPSGTDPAGRVGERRRRVEVAVRNDGGNGHDDADGPWGRRPPGGGD